MASHNVFLKDFGSTKSTFFLTQSSYAKTVHLNLKSMLCIPFLKSLRIAGIPSMFFRHCSSRLEVNVELNMESSHHSCSLSINQLSIFETHALPVLSLHGSTKDQTLRCWET
ncbi:hypothetical protein AHAS_AhasUnG0040100 [Arachis hypogaea]